MLFNELFFFFFFVFFDVVFTTKQHFSPQFSLLMLSFKKKGEKKKLTRQKKGEFWGLNWIGWWWWRAKEELCVSFLSLFLAIDDDEMVVVMPIAFFFRVLRLLVLTKEKPSSRVRAIIIRILPWERKTHRILYLHGLHIFYRLFHRTGHVGDRNRFRYLQKTVVTSFISIRLLSQLQSRRGRDECARGRHHGHHFFIRFFFLCRVFV